MASNGVDPTYGYPKFPESDAPQLGADLEEVAAYARYRGNRIVETAAARTAFTSAGFAYKGLEWFEADTDKTFVHDGTNWVDMTPGTAPFIQTGTVTTTSEPTTGRQGLVFSFPVPFAAAPTLIVTGHISPGGNPVQATSAISATTATQGGIYYIASAPYSTGAQATFSWVAFGVKA